MHNGFFFTKLGEKSETRLNEFAKIFLQKCQVIEIRSWQTEQAITMFNSLNSTGIPLSDADIISAQLYSNAGEKKSVFNEQWEQIHKLANELNTQKIIDIDGVLQQFMYINRAINREYISIKENGSISVDVATPGLRRYYTDIKKELLEAPLELCDNLSKVTKIWDNIKDYPVVKLLLKCNENAKLFLSGYLFRYDESEISEDMVLEICECLLRLFTVLELSDVGYSSSKFKTFLFSENVKFVDKNISIEEIKNDFDEHINKNWTEEEIKENILEYDKNLLVFLNEYIYSKKKGVEFDFADKTNVEHIMPASGRNITTIQQDANIADREEFASVVNRLGNKILLEENINKSISNEWFKTKKQSSIITKSGYKDSKYAIAQALTTYYKDTWTKEDIAEATQKATDRIVKFVFNK
ncbi:HNH endonuclease family protein [Riemerella anatipestifer]|uniref:HNH endonuclease family protein n=1 Tax=Riemerella anatipestifer TaxID=34085 RepID=UPI00285FF24E|nr:HNH endonuclease family protein [Riemerella anatipestifer]MDR7695327.1 HNH endonuclease family protein [Riemerella anatipestifer]